MTGYARGTAVGRLFVLFSPRWLPQCHNCGRRRFFSGWQLFHPESYLPLKIHFSLLDPFLNLLISDDLLSKIDLGPLLLGGCGLPQVRQVHLIRVEAELLPHRLLIWCRWLPRVRLYCIRFHLLVEALHGLGTLEGDSFLLQALETVSHSLNILLPLIQELVVDRHSRVRSILFLFGTTATLWDWARYPLLMYTLSRMVLWLSLRLESLCLRFNE